MYQSRQGVIPSLGQNDTEKPPKTTNRVSLTHIPPEKGGRRFFE